MTFFQKRYEYHHIRCGDIKYALGLAFEDLMYVVIEYLSNREISLERRMPRYWCHDFIIYFRGICYLADVKTSFDPKYGNTLLVNYKQYYECNVEVKKQKKTLLYLFFRPDLNCLFISKNDKNMEDNLNFGEGRKVKYDLSNPITSYDNVLSKKDLDFINEKLFEANT